MFQIVRSIEKNKLMPETGAYYPAFELQLSRSGVLFRRTKAATPQGQALWGAPVYNTAVVEHEAAKILQGLYRPALFASHTLPRSAPA